MTTAATDAAVSPAVDPTPAAPVAPEVAPDVTGPPERATGDKFDARRSAVTRAQERYEQAQESFEQANEEAKARQLGTPEVVGVPEGGDQDADPAAQAAEPVDQVQEGATAAPGLTQAADGSWHRPDGSFASAEEIEAAAGIQPAEAAAPASVPEPERQTVPEGYVRVELPADHPWRRGGAFGELVIPAESEQLVRTAANNVVRRQENETLRSQLAAESRARVKAETEAMLARSGKLRSPETDPETKAFLDDVQKHYPPEIYESVKAGFERAGEAEVEAALADHDVSMEVKQLASVFLGDVKTRAPQKYAVWGQTGELDGRLAREVADYGDLVDARNEARAKAGHSEILPTSDEFFRRLDMVYVSDPRVLQRIEAFRETQFEAERQKVREQTRTELAATGEVGQRHSSVRGVAKVGAGVRTGQRALEPETPADKIKDLSPSERRTALRDRARARGRA